MKDNTENSHFPVGPVLFLNNDIHMLSFLLGRQPGMEYLNYM